MTTIELQKYKSNIQPNEESNPTCFEIFATGVSYLILVLTFPISIFLCLIIALEYQRIIIFRLGKLRPGGARGPGVIFFLPCIDEYFLIDLRIETFEVTPQDVLTKDAVSIRVDAVVFFRVEDAKLAMIEVGDYKYSTMLLAQSTLRNVVGTKKLVDFLIQKEEVAHTLKDILDAATDVWGIKVERVEIKHIRLPLPMLRSMAAEAEANREAKARRIHAEGEKSAANALKEASLIMSSAPIAIQLRYLQSLKMVSTESSGTIILPLPSSIAKRWLRLDSASLGSSGSEI